MSIITRKNEYANFIFQKIQLLQKTHKLHIIYFFVIFSWKKRIHLRTYHNYIFLLLSKSLSYTFKLIVYNVYIIQKISQTLSSITKIRMFLYIVRKRKTN